MAHPHYDQNSDTDGPTRFEVIAAGLAALWLIVVGIFFWVMPSAPQPNPGFDGLRAAMTLIAVFMPVALIWLAVMMARAARAQKADTAALHRAVQDMQQSLQAGQLAAAKAEPSVEQRLDELVQATKSAESAITTFASRREVSRLIVPQPAPRPTTAQQTLPLGTSAEEHDPPLDRADLIRGLNFPDHEGDQDGFAALRRTLRDRTARKLVQASQDVLTLLSQDGIYMDDVRPDRPDPDIWRRFAKGERGQEVNSVGGVHDRTALALTVGRMREDAIFRDTVHHFLRKFDQMLANFEGSATDTDLLALADTRTARAFMLLGRSTGTFD